MFIDLPITIAIIVNFKILVTSTKIVILNYANLNR